MSHINDCGTLLRRTFGSETYEATWSMGDNCTLWSFVFCTFRCWGNGMLRNVQHVQEK